jgi:hypothetical protein
MAFITGYDVVFPDQVEFLTGTDLNLETEAEPVITYLVGKQSVAGSVTASKSSSSSSVAGLAQKCEIATTKSCHYSLTGNLFESGSNAANKEISASAVGKQSITGHVGTTKITPVEITGTLGWRGNSNQSKTTFSSIYSGPGFYFSLESTGKRITSTIGLDGHLQFSRLSNSEIAAYLSQFGRLVVAKSNQQNIIGKNGASGSITSQKISTVSITAKQSVISVIESSKNSSVNITAKIAQRGFIERDRQSPAAINGKLGLVGNKGNLPSCFPYGITSLTPHLALSTE